MGNNRAFEILEDVTYEYMSKIRVVEAMKQYAKECVKASLERASERVGYMQYSDGTACTRINKQSILNEDNIVLV